jgi:hypothetical protein
MFSYVYKREKAHASTLTVYAALMLLMIIYIFNLGQDTLSFISSGQMCPHLHKWIWLVSIYKKAKELKNTILSIYLPIKKAKELKNTSHPKTPTQPQTSCVMPF